jgi:NAD(P)-dependent dehydrogenase (short-subunit alcohol dehydrogenase family)
MPTVALVTGSNQGLGFALVECLCRTLGTGAVVYLTARDAERGAQAVQRLRDENLSPTLHPLDVTDDASVAALALTVRARHGRIDIVISNAAARISREIPQAEQVARFVDTNDHGTFLMIRAFAPLLHDGARFLVVASAFGSLLNLAPTLHARFDVASRSLDDIERVMDDYAHLVQKGGAEADGWPAWINIASKIGQVASMKIVARLMKDDAQRRGILINAVRPGLVDPEASRPWFDDVSSVRSPLEAAGDVIWLAILPVGTVTPYGELVQSRRLIPWL